MIRFWYHPGMDNLILRMTTQNPCGCHPNDILVETKYVYSRKIYTQMAKLEPKKYFNFIRRNGWKELK